MTQLQGTRQVEITTPLGEDVLLLRSMSVTEELGRLFQMELELLSENANINFEDLLGESITIRLTLPEGKERYFNGLVSRFSQEGTLGRHHAYSATVHPWLWFLTRTADCRIFQELTVPDIIKKVFRDLGFTDFEEALSGTYRTWAYCVQYRETDFNFVSRLMEQEGIYYYFKHEREKHTLVLSDSISSHEAVQGYENIPYYPPGDNAQRERDHIFEWTIAQQVQPGVYALNDYDFTRPNANLQTKSAISRNHARAAMEIYDYPGEYQQAGDGEAYARARIESLQAEFEEAHGAANARGLAAGSLFEMTQYPRTDQNREYLVVTATHSIVSDDYESAGGEAEEVYSCSFSVIHSQQPFRPARTTPKPLVQGPQTAVVVGKSGEEIWTDKYGRVKIQFHWDRYGKRDENSSCWVRVSHPWAGKSWGAVALPRMGQEVIVDFLEGDPDQPIITGRVYNNDNMPPYGLPANATQSGVKSRSSKGGNPDNFNELRFEDKKGEEEIYLHGEKNWTINIENDKNQTIGNDETLSVANNRKKSVGVDQSEEIGANKTITVGGNHSESISGNMTQTVSQAKAETITLAKALSIGAGYQVSVGAAMNQSVGGLKAEEIGAVKSVNVVGNSSENVGGSKSVSAKNNIDESATKNVSISSGKKMTLTAGDDFTLSGEKKGAVTIKDQLTITGKKKGMIDIKDQLTIKVGKASITLKKNGDIAINGKNIKMKGSGNITLKGKKILEN